MIIILEQWLSQEAALILGLSDWSLKKLTKLGPATFGWLEGYHARRDLCFSDECSKLVNKHIVCVDC